MVHLTESEHLSDALLMAMIHGEATDASGAIEAHLRDCPRCAAQRDRLGQDDTATGLLLTALDGPDRPIPAPRFAGRVHRSVLRRGVAAAAAAATLAVAAAAVVLPTSPIHRWIAAAPPGLAAERVPARPRPPVVGAEAGVQATSGIAIAAPSRLDVVLQQVQRHGAIIITRTASGDVAVRSRGGNAAYQVGTGQLVIDNRIPAELYQIDIPVSVRRMRVLAGNRVLLRWPEDSARFSSASATDRPSFRLDLGAPGVP